MKAQIFLAFMCVAGCSKIPTYEPPPEQRVMDSEKQSFAAAKDLAAKGDLEGAHGKLSEINVSAPARSTPEFIDIENRWAKARIAKADAEKDPQKRIAILQEIAGAPSVSGELRAEASNKIAAATPDPAIPPILVDWDPEAAKANLAKCQELLDQKKLKEAKDLLAPRVLAKQGSPDEREMLIMVCVSLKDKACMKQLEEVGYVRAGMADKMLLPPPKPSAGARSQGGVGPPVN